MTASPESGIWKLISRGSSSPTSSSCYQAWLPCQIWRESCVRSELGGSNDYAVKDMYKIRVCNSWCFCIRDTLFFLGGWICFANFTNRTFPKLGAVDREEVATLFWGFEGIGTMECTHAAATLHRRARGRSYRQRTWQWAMLMIRVPRINGKTTQGSLDSRFWKVFFF